MRENGFGGEWFEELPRTGRIYQLIENSRESEKMETRIQALRALGESEDPRAVRPLIEYTGDQAAEIRRYATEGLFKLRSPRGVEALYNRLKDRHEEYTTRKLAADALGEIRSHRALESLVECLLNSEEDRAIREYVAEVLARTRTEIARRALAQCGSGEGVEAQTFRTIDTGSSNIEQRNWSIPKSPVRNQSVKEGSAFMR